MFEKIRSMKVNYSVSCSRLQLSNEPETLHGVYRLASVRTDTAGGFVFKITKNVS